MLTHKICSAFQRSLKKMYNIGIPAAAAAAAAASLTDIILWDCHRDREPTPLPQQLGSPALDHRHRRRRRRRDHSR
jgi:hypothetical protein